MEDITKLTMEKAYRIISGEHHKSYLCEDGLKVDLFKINKDAENYFVVTKKEGQEQTQQVIPICDMEVMMCGIKMKEVAPPAIKGILAMLGEKKSV